jgi:homoserine acetyltransferase
VTSTSNRRNDSGCATDGGRRTGTLNDARDNVIVYPCSYTATHDDLAWLIGSDGVLGPDREWFIIVPDMFSNGFSSSPSNTELTTC